MRKKVERKLLYLNKKMNTNTISIVEKIEYEAMKKISGYKDKDDSKFSNKEVIDSLSTWKIIKLSLYLFGIQFRSKPSAKDFD